MSRMYQIPLTVALFFISAQCYPLCSELISSCKNEPSLPKNQLREQQLLIMNCIWVSLEKVHTIQTAGQRKEETSKTMSSFIPHLTGPKRE